MDVAAYREAWRARMAAAREERERRRREAIAAIRAAAPLLRTYGVGEAFVFGSFAAGEPDDRSDLDVAVSGAPAGRFYALSAELTARAPVQVHLVDLATCPPTLAFAVRERGVRILP